MNNLKFSLIFLFIISLSINAQESKLNEDVSTYIESNGSMIQYNYAYDQLLHIMQKKFPKSEKNKEGWLYLEQNKANALAEIKEMLVGVYASNFEHEDIQKMITFYQSDSGKQLLSDRSKMTDKQKQELNTFYNSPVGSSILEKQTILTKEIEKISEIWSRKLYNTALYRIKQ